MTEVVPVPVTRPTPLRPHGVGRVCQDLLAFALRLDRGVRREDPTSSGPRDLGPLIPLDAVPAPLPASAHLAAAHAEAGAR